jgi:hypothetical protein
MQGLWHAISEGCLSGIPCEHLSQPLQDSAQCPHRCSHPCPKPLDQQAWICAVATCCSLCSHFASSPHMSQYMGQHDIQTSLVCQLILGLCSQSQVKPRIMLAQLHDHKFSTLYMPIVSEDNVCDLTDCTALIGCSINIVDWDWLCLWSQLQH